MPAYASALPTADSQLHADLASAITKLTSILSSVDGLEGYTDQLEGLLTTLNGLLSPPLLVDSSTLATAAKQDTLATKLTDGSARIGGTVATTGPLTDSQLRATAIPVTGSLSAATTRTAKGNKSLAVAGAAVLLSTVSGGIPTGATVFEFVPTVDVRYTDDGTTTPTASVGIPVVAGQAWSINSDLTKVKFYGVAGQVDGGFYT